MSFYSALKPSDSYLRFVFITGVSKFRQVSIFSDLNNLTDISLMKEYATLCGYTQKELEECFPEHIQKLAKENELSERECIAGIRRWYNGFRFSGQAETKVYNPFSTLLLFTHGYFASHWFETGSPTFLINLIKNNNYPVEKLEKVRLSED